MVAPLDTIELGVIALRRFGGRMLDRLAAAVLADPTPETAQAILDHYRDPWARLFARSRLAAIAEGMVDAWDLLPLELTEEEERDVAVIASQFADQTDARKLALLETFTPEEQLIAAAFLGLPPVEPPAGELAVPEDDDFDGLRLPTYDWALEELAARRLVTRDEWDQLEGEQLEEAFTVAGLESEAAIGQVRDALAQTLKEGLTLEEFKQAASPGNFLGENHAETVFRTNLHESYSDGKLALIEHPLVADAFPYGSLDPIVDDRTRPWHLLFQTAGLDGTNIYRIDDPVFQTFRGPWEWSCRCGWGPVTVRQAARRGVKEAQRWLEEGPPKTPEHVAWPMYRGVRLLPDPRYRRG